MLFKLYSVFRIPYSVRRYLFSGARFTVYGTVSSLLVLFLLLLTACVDPALECTDPLGCVEIRPDDPLLVAALLDQSGRAAALSAEVQNGLLMALADRDNELLGHRLELVPFDGGCQESGGAASAREILADGRIAGVLGTVCSESAAAAIPLLAERGMVMVSPANTAPRLTETAVSPTFFRVAYNNRLQADLMAEFAFTTLGARTAAIIRDTTAYSIDLAATFTDHFTTAGGVILYEGVLSPGQVDIAEKLDLLLRTAPDVVYMPLFEPEAAYFVVQVHEQETLTEVPLLGTDTLLLESFARSIGTGADSTYLSAAAVSSTAYDLFLQRWADRYGVLPTTPFAAYAYDAANLLLDQITAVAQLSNDNSLLIGRQALLDAVAGTQNYEALTGTLTCQESGDCAARSSLAVLQLVDWESEESGWPPAVVWHATTP